MLVEMYIEKVINSCKRALENIEDGNLRSAIGDIHYIIDRANAAKYIAEIELQEQEEILKQETDEDKLGCEFK